MSSDAFGKWWPCLRKHYKRTHVWLPRAKSLLEQLQHERQLRYFTLCARSMIDVYMLVKENILPLDDETRRIDGVWFCESDEQIFPEVKELIGVEESGFLAKLENLVLFEDIEETKALDSLEHLYGFLEERGEGLGEDVLRKVEEKRSHLLFRQLFPFDFLNLDFCDPFYPDPPDIMKIHETVGKLLDWQRQTSTSASGASFSAKRFVVALTCRFDSTTPVAALERLRRIVKANSEQHAEYRAALSQRSVDDIASWSTTAPLDFFMSAWPKEIAKLAQQKGWDITVHDHVHYERQGDSGVKYEIVCLVVEFVQTSLCKTYLDAVTKCLEQSARTSVPHFEAASGDGIALASDLQKIVKIRNQQAENFARAVLPDPILEISRLRGLGVQI